jgi:hypothetical protein
VWLTALDPAIGSEIQETRPRGIVSPREKHDYLEHRGSFLPQIVSLGYLAKEICLYR